MYRNIGTKLNISFDDYIDRPRYDIETINRLADKMDQEKIKANTETLGDLEKNYKDPGKKEGSLIV